MGLLRVSPLSLSAGSCSCPPLGLCSERANLSGFEKGSSSAGWSEAKYKQYWITMPSYKLGSHGALCPVVSCEISLFSIIFPSQMWLVAVLRLLVEAVSSWLFSPFLLQIRSLVVLLTFFCMPIYLKPKEVLGCSYQLHYFCCRRCVIHTTEDRMRNSLVCPVAFPDVLSLRISQILCLGVPDSLTLR